MAHINHHTQLLNYLINKHGLQSYLEIGVNNPMNNYHKIRLPVENKVGVDPCLTLKDNLLPITSDIFFARQTDKFDLIFIDGLHYADQVKKDFENSLACLNDGGYILIHDTLPPSEETTCVPRGTQKQWWGDVYLFAMRLCEYDGIGFITFDFDCGCTLVWKEPGKKGIGYSYNNCWRTFEMAGRVLLNVSHEAAAQKMLT